MLTGSALVGVVAGVAVAAILPDAAPVASDAAQFLVGVAPPVAVGAGTTAIVHRTWLGRVRRAVAQALDGIGMTARHGHRATSPTVDWREVKRRWLGGD